MERIYAEQESAADERSLVKQGECNGCKLVGARRTPSIARKKGVSEFGQSYMLMGFEKTCYGSVRDDSTCCITYKRLLSKKVMDNCLVGVNVFVPIVA
nr:hypothetical protein [Tanacetum cinerariifolium]